MMDVEFEEVNKIASEEFRDKYFLYAPRKLVKVHPMMTGDDANRSSFNISGRVRLSSINSTSSQGQFRG